jgi:hypothetical protein
MASGTEKAIAELDGLNSTQQRVDRVTEDFHSGKNRFECIGAWDLGELLGLEFENTGDWNRSFWAFRPEMEQDEFEYPFAENVALLKGEIPSHRFEELAARSGRLVQGAKGGDLRLTKKEGTILRDAYAEANAGDSNLILAELSLAASDGREINFEVCVGDAGEPCDPMSPYDLENGLGFKTDEWIETF